MKIITLFAMGEDRSVATTDQTNFGLPWERNKGDMSFVREILTKYEGSNSILLMTTATYNSLPKSLLDDMYDSYSAIVRLGSEHLQLPTAVPAEQFAKVFKQGLGLVIDINSIDTILYFGSPKFLDRMVRISDETYVTVMSKLLANPIVSTDSFSENRKYSKTYIPYETKEHLLIRSPKVKLKEITNGTIYRVASKQYETV